MTDNQPTTEVNIYKPDEEGEDIAGKKVDQSTYMPFLFR